MNQEELSRIQRHRQQGADIAADHSRAEAGNRLWRAVPYAAALVLTMAGIHFAAKGAGSEEDHAPRPPAALASQPNRPHDLPPTTP